MRAHTRKTMKHEQENMKELLKKKYLSPLIESYDMVGENLLGVSKDPGVDAGGFIPGEGENTGNGGGLGGEESSGSRFRGSFYSNGYEEY